MAKCTACKQQFDAPFWKLATLCPQCKAAQAALHANLQAITPAFIVTPILVGLNVFVFIAMVFSGVSFMEPDTADLIHWGASFGPYTLGAQPWRAFTCMFVHIGIIHLLLNMWCLWSLGLLAERLMGNWNYLLLYLLSGLGGSVFSLWLHPQLVSAGASGAIFGVAGGLVSLLAMKKAQIPQAAIQRTLKSVLLFVGYNLLYGMRGGIDNAAHVGGLAAGLALGAFLPRRQLFAPPAAEGVPAQPAAIEEGTSGSFFSLGVAVLACALAGGFGYARRTHGTVNSTTEQTEIELFKLSKSDRTELQEGAKLLKGGNVDGAMISLSAVAARAPQSAVAHVLLGEAHYQKKQYDQAIQELTTAVTLAPDYATAHSELGMAYLFTHQDAQAIQEYRVTLRLNPRDGNAHNNLGALLERNGDLKGAFAEYTAAIAIDPDNDTFKNNYDRVSKEQGAR